MGEYCAHAVCAMDGGWVIVCLWVMGTHSFLRSETDLSFVFSCSFCLCRLLHLPNSRFMLAIHIREQHSIFALKMGRAFLTYWEHAGQFLCMLWKRQFKILFVLRLKKNTSPAEVAEVRALLLLFRVIIFFVVKFAMPILGHQCGPNP